MKHALNLSWIQGTTPLATPMLSFELGYLKPAPPCIAQQMKGTSCRMLRLELGKSNTDPILPGHFATCNVKLGIFHFVNV